MSVRISSLLLIGLINVFFLAGNANAAGGVKVINGEKLQQLANYDEDMMVFDARSEAIRKKGHIRWSEAFSKKNLVADWMAKKVAGKRTVVVFYGNANSKKASKAAAAVAALGYTSVYWFKGGWPEWQQKGLKLD